VDSNDSLSRQTFEKSFTANHANNNNHISVAAAVLLVVVVTNASATTISRHMAPYDAQNSAIPGAMPPKIGEDLLRYGQTAMQNFTPIGKDLAEKSVTVENK